LLELGTRLRDRLFAGAEPLRAVHGDAHLGNVIQTSRGPLWNDWEDAHLAPTIWDLGCLHASSRAFNRAPAPVAAAQRGYGDFARGPALTAAVTARVLQAVVWSGVIAQARDEPTTAPDRLVGWLRSHTR
jgi:aminoglycoside phosphotransferase (APT) family kinase protein